MSDRKITRSVADDGAIVVALSGALNIETSGELHRLLSDSLYESQRVVLDAQQIESIDASTMQVICSACRSAVLQERSLVCGNDVPASLVSFGRNIGAPQGVPCNRNSNDPCIWFGG